MTRRRKKFLPLSKAKAVQFVIEAGCPVAELACERWGHEGALGKWVSQWKRENPEYENALSPLEQVRVAVIEDEMRKLRVKNLFVDVNRLLHGGPG